MGNQARGDYDSESVIQFAPAAKNAASTVTLVPVPMTTSSRSTRR